MIEITLPTSCANCRFIGGYIDGICERKLYYCCELASLLFREKYKVRPNVLEDFCPLKKGIIGVEE